MGERNAVTGALNSEIPANDEPKQLVDDVEISSNNEQPTTVRCSGVIPDNEVSGTALVNDSGQHGSEDEKSPTTENGKGKRKLSVSPSSSWSLRSRSREKPKPPEPVEMVTEEGSDGETRKRGRKKLDKGSSQNEFSRVRRHLGYLLHRINYEQSLIDAYCAEGWKKQSLEKLKPEKEIEHAKSQILRYKLKVRSLFQHLDQLLSVGRIPDSLFDSEGEIDSEDIFCAKCGSKDLTLDNDIILCDGACERGFHQYCLEPPLLKEDIPPGDEGWICPGCDCKLFCIDMLNDYRFAKVSLFDSWENIFPEAARATSGNNVDDASESSSDDYDPNKPEEASQKVHVDNSKDSDYFSPPEDSVPVHSNQLHEGLPSEDSDDDDFDPNAPHKDEEAKTSSSSSDFTSASEDFGALLEDEADMEVVSGHVSPSRNADDSIVGNGKRPSQKEEVSYLQETSAEPVSPKRKMPRLDYKKLHDEAYGNSSSSDSSDEDFEGAVIEKKRRIRLEKAEVDSPRSTSITKPSRNLGSIGESSKRVRTPLRKASKQKLQSSFAENMYPERSVKEKLAKELGMSVRQVSKWFETARWRLRHNRQMVSSGFVEFHPKATKNKRKNNLRSVLKHSF